MADVLKPSEKVAAGTSFIEGITGLAAVALAIIALAGIFPYSLVAIATIVTGAAMVFEAGTISARFSYLMKETRAPVEEDYSWSRWGGITSSFIAGAAGIVLGILALLRIYPMILVPVAVIGFGAGMVMDSGVRTRLSALECECFGLAGWRHDLAEESAAASSGIQVFIGLAAITMGILALVGIAPLILSLVGLLSVGSGVLIVGTVAGTKMMGVVRR